MWSDALLNHPKLVFLMCLISSTTMFQLGYVASYPNTAFLAFRTFFNESFEQRGEELTESRFSWLWAVVLNVWFVGFLCGTWLSPTVADRRGRKVGLVLGNSIDIIGTAITLAAIYLNVPELMGIGRFAVGIGDGLAANSLTLFLQESAPTRIRGFVSSFQELSVAFSTLAGTVCGLPYVLGDNLVWLVGVAVLPNAVLMLTMAFCPDTPKYLLLGEQNEQKAIASLHFYHSGEQDVRARLDGIALERDEGKTTLREILRSSYLRKAMMLGCAAFALQVLTGIFPTTLYSTVFFRRAGASEFAAEMGAIGMMLCNCTATALAMASLDHFGRRPMLLGCGSLNVLALVFYTIFSALSELTSWAKYGCLGSMFAFSFTFSLGVGPVPWFLTAELVPHKQRSLIQSIGYSTNTLFALITGLLTLPLYNTISAYSFIPLFIVPSLLCIVYLYRELPETKNREIHDIVNQLRGSSSVLQTLEDKERL